MKKRIPGPGILAALVLSFVASQPARAQAIDSADAACRKAIGKSVRTLTKTLLVEQGKCHADRMRGRIDALVDCDDIADSGFPSSSLAKIQKAISAFSDDAAGSCAQPTGLPADNGYDQCPAPCDGEVPAIATYRDVASCLACLAEDEATVAVSAAYGADPPVVAKSSGEWKCQNRYVGPAMRQYVKAMEKEQQRCQYDEDKGSIGATDCATADLRGRVARALDKLQARISRCEAGALGSLTSCGTSVSAEQDCIRTAAETFTGDMFDFVYPSGSVVTTTSSTTTTTTTTLGEAGAYTVVDTDQVLCYNNIADVSCPAVGQAFYGQDAHYSGPQPSYHDNGDGTVTDLNTGLMWQQDPGAKQTYAEAVAGADGFSLAGYDDWRLPTIKELFSLILFSGEDPSGETGTDTSGLVPFIDDSIFAFSYGDPGAGERIIDSQWTTSSVYGSTVMDGSGCFFGVNFADGRIKCYPLTVKTYFTLYVRGKPSYGSNLLGDNGDGTVTDAATGLMWMQADSGYGMVWQDALSYCENASAGGHGDWRLPDAKELQSIVDYSRAPDTTGSAAIDPLFSCSSIVNEAGQADYPFYWSSSTHASSNGMGDTADYLAFGRALGYFAGHWQDVHGAGAQRSDPKTGNPDDYPQGRGPQGDAIRIYNYVRCVRNAG